MTTLKDFDYEDIKVIGRGQYGKAHLVTSGKDQLYYIAKTIDLTCLSKNERETSLQEVQLLRRLDHPSIVEYKDNFFMGDTLVIIMQYCEGGDLSTYIKEMAKKRMRIREEQIMNYFVQVLLALQYIHSERILHRDLKTSNLFLTKKASLVKLGDFGISRVLEGSVQAAITVVGTPYYMSPEICENKPYTFKSDVWSFGCVLYELCMLKHAFAAENLLGLVYKIVSDKYEPIPKMYSQELNRLIKGMLEKIADARPSVGNLLADPYVQRFMNEYVRTRGQCATPASASARSGVPRSGGGGGGGAGGAGGIADRRARGSAAGKAAERGGAKPSAETPKEAAARRKREAADRNAEVLKAATREAASKKTVARRMKEAEFQTTGAASSRGADGGCGASGEGAWLLQGAGSTTASNADDLDRSGSETPEDELERPLEDISEGDTSAEEYEDDFEDDFCTEDEVDEEYELAEFGANVEVGHLSMVREEQDFTRVMSNYEQELGRRPAGAGVSPQRRRAGSFDRAAAEPAAAAAVASAAAAAGAGRSGGGNPADIVDIRKRASRLRDELIRKMGADTFQKTFDYLYKARTTNVHERIVSKDLQALIGKENYKAYCFDVDQLVFQQMLYS